MRSDEQNNTVGLYFQVPAPLRREFGALCRSSGLSVADVLRTFMQTAVKNSAQRRRELVENVREAAMRHLLNGK